MKPQIGSPYSHFVLTSIIGTEKIIAESKGKLHALPLNAMSNALSGLSFSFNAAIVQCSNKKVFMMQSLICFQVSNSNSVFEKLTNESLRDLNLFKTKCAIASASIKERLCELL